MLITGCFIHFNEQYDCILVLKKKYTNSYILRIPIKCSTKKRGQDTTKVYFNRIDVFN